MYVYIHTTHIHTHTYTHTHTHTHTHTQTGFAPHFLESLEQALTKRGVVSQELHLAQFKTHSIVREHIL